MGPWKLLLSLWCAAACLAAPSLDAAHRLPLRFEPNRGQAEPWVRFIARGGGRTVLLGASEARLGIHPQSPRVRLLRANPNARLSGLDRLPGQSSYFLPSRVLGGIESYGRVQVSAVWPHIALLYYGSLGELEYDFVVAPHGDAGLIELEFQHVSSLRIDPEGHLVLGTAAGEIRQRKPLAYQDSPERRRPVDCRYVLSGRRRVRFRVGPYDANSPLIIDPVLDYSSYIGGSGDDRAYGVTVDAAGCTYLVGETSSLNFPRRGTTRAWAGYTDVFVLKLKTADNTLVYSGYLGGLRRDSGRAIAVDSAGNAYIAGFTYSSDFPVTAGAPQRSAPGIPSAFAARLDASGSTLLYSTYIGGSGENYASGIAVDAGGNAYVAGYTSSAAFPTTAGALRRTFAGGAYDVFLVKLDALATGFAYSTYLGGTGNDVGMGVTVDSAGSAYVAGQTSSSDFPVQAAYQSAKSGDTDAFLAKLNPWGSALVYSSFLGGVNTDLATAIAVDAAGSAYVAGGTVSEDFPTTAAAPQRTNAGSYDAFLAKFDAAGSLAYSTLLGGSGSDQANAIAVDAAGNAYIAGLTSSASFPAAVAEGSYHGSYDCFVAGLNAAGSAWLFLAYAGGSGFDLGQGIAAAPSGAVFVTGATFSNDFPMQPGAWQPRYGGSGDAFLLRIGAQDTALFWQHDATQQVAAWLFRATTRLSAVLLNDGRPAAPDWKLAAIADLDGNGSPDLFWQNHATQQIGIWYLGGSQGTTKLSASWLNGGQPAAPNWLLAAVADLDGNGTPDLIWQNTATQHVGVWYMGGPQGATRQASTWLNDGVPAAAGWSLRTAADLDGNGVPDLVWQNNTTRQVGVWYMGGPRGAAKLSTALIDGGLPASADGLIVGSTDINGDGKPDLLWQNGSTWQVEVWFLSGAQGTTKIGTAAMGPAPEPGWRARI